LTNFPKLPDGMIVPIWGHLGKKIPGEIPGVSLSVPALRAQAITPCLEAGHRLSQAQSTVRGSSPAKPTSCDQHEPNSGLWQIQVSCKFRSLADSGVWEVVAFDMAMPEEPSANLHAVIQPGPGTPLTCLSHLWIFCERHQRHGPPGRGRPRPTRQAAGP